METKGKKQWKPEKRIKPNNCLRISSSEIKKKKAFN